MQNKKKLTLVFLWVWVIGFSIGYLIQFSKYVNPVLRLVGLK